MRRSRRTTSSVARCLKDGTGRNTGAVSRLDAKKSTSSVTYKNECKMKAAKLQATVKSGRYLVQCPDPSSLSRCRSGLVNMDTVCQHCRFCRELAADYVKCLYDEVQDLPEERKKAYMSKPSQDEAMQ